MVMGGDLCSKGFWFKSQPRIPVGRFSHLFVVTIVMFVRQDENKRKRGRDGAIKKFSETLVVFRSCSIKFPLVGEAVIAQWIRIRQPSFHPAAPGSNPKHNIYAFSI